MMGYVVGGVLLTLGLEILIRWSQRVEEERGERQARGTRHGHRGKRERESDARVRWVGGVERQRARAARATATGDLFCFCAANPPPSAIVGHRTNNVLDRGHQTLSIMHNEAIKRTSRCRLDGHVP